MATSLPRVAEIEEDLELHWLFHLRGATQAPPEVVVVAIDEQSAQELGLPSKPSEWPRDLHAQLIERLARAGARVICFDLTFDTPSRTPQNDVEFAAAIGRAANVVLTDSLRKETARQTNNSGQAIGEIQIERVSPPIPVLEQAALAHAPFPLPKESRVNTFWTFKSSAGDSPTLPVIAFQIYAFDAYGDFLDLLGKAAPRLAITPPASAKALVASNGAGSLITTLRNVFLSDPQLGERMLRELNNTSDPDLTPKRKQIIQSLLSLYRRSEVSYLNFHGPPRSITTVSYHEVLHPRDGDPKVRSVNNFEDKAVFVGFSASSQPEQDRIRDDYQTVFSQRSGLNISGVEIAATAFANLLEDRPVRPIPFPWQLGIVTLWGVALGTACRMLRPIAAAVVVLILASAYLLVALRQFAVASMWLPLVIPLCLQAPLALFGGALLNYRDARRERKLIKQAFGYYLPDKIVDQLAESVGPISSADQLVYGACLATDVEKYTTLAETMSPRELGKLMNEYYAELFKPVERLGGVVNEVVGDAMLAIWAASSSEASVRKNACEAALDIVEALDRFNQAVVGRPPLLTRFGLHSGQVLLGNIGASRHYEYQAVGDMVNTATRIEGLSKYLGTRILASEETVDGLEDFLTRPVGCFLLAGKATAVCVVELSGREQDANPQVTLLYQKFADALEAYRTRQWRDAASKFSEILDAFPEDGPSRFYLHRCESYVLNPPDEPWQPTVRLDQK
ncbi:MAG TPA: adenylate/guanylate cyclase domain-containing protein [Casimicrobiaceae bacterium]|nr:adenylate/guanylate cyclase domain-containing protein [Casimicrobiaceae bacterium]